jgi:hypothetical protein
MKSNQCLHTQSLLESESECTAQPWHEDQQSEHSRGIYGHRKILSRKNILLLTSIWIRRAIPDILEKRILLILEHCTSNLQSGSELAKQAINETRLTEIQASMN